MREKIIKNIDNPEVLEALFRSDEAAFRKSFTEISTDYDTELVRFWRIRLMSTNNGRVTGFNKLDLIFVLAVAVIAAALSRFPLLIPRVGQEDFYLRNLPALALAGLVVFTFRIRNITDPNKRWISLAIIALVLAFINFLPTGKHDSVLIAALHVPLLLWCLWGVLWTGFEYRNSGKRMEFIRFNGELVIMTGLILLAGGLLAAITISLFDAIGINISEAYLENIALPGAVAAPVISHYLIRLYPNVTSRISPVIAKVFTPIVLLTLVVYLISVVTSGTRLLEDRTLLLIFNAMLLGVLALIIFSVAEIPGNRDGNKNTLILFILAVCAILINGIALAAITGRILGGLTPNRAAVLVTNILIFINLVLLAIGLFQAYRKGSRLAAVEKTISDYLTVYAIWTVVAVFGFPLLFSFR